MNIVDHAALDLAELIKTKTYAQVVEQTGLSKGAIHRRLEKVGYYTRRREERRQRLLAAMTNEIVRGDVIDGLEQLPNNSVQCIITSPPYNVGKAYGYEPTTDRMRPLKYFAWLCEIVDECDRVLADGGTIAMIVGNTYDRFGTLIPIDWLLSRAFEQTDLRLQNRINWPGDHGLTPKRTLAHRNETILVYSKGTPVFNPNSCRRPQKNFAKRAFKGPRKGELTSNPLGAYPSDVFADIKHLRHNAREKAEHPCQFPIALAKRLVMLYSLPGHLICDPFRGSGTTHAACIETGRNFVGWDLFYEDIAAEVVARTKPDTVTPLTGVTPESMAFWAAQLGGDPTRARAQRVNERGFISDDDDRILALDLFPDLRRTA